jgi:glycosyltransferase involved in cell wall biosynthesis
MNRERVPVLLVGAFPPPVHGVAAMNAAAREALQRLGVEPRVINLAAPTLDRSLLARLGRLPRVLHGLLVCIGARQLGGGGFYMSLSGGLGQIYELMFITIARLRGMRLFLHHNSFAYLDRPSPLTALLVRVAGSNSVHVAVSLRMAERLQTLYQVGRTVLVSNSIVRLREEVPLVEPRRRLRTLGFFSNIAAEKGVFEFLDLLDRARELRIPLYAKLAGPFQDAETERMVRARLPALPNLEYVGPKYRAEKDAFFAGVDVLVFPTRYPNEAEPLTIHEAMSGGVPVIAYGRGAIPEIVDAHCGKVIDPAQPFVPEALAQIEVWLTDPGAFEAASKTAIQRFVEIYALNERSWRKLLGDLTAASAADHVC